MKTIPFYTPDRTTAAAVRAGIEAHKAREVFTMTDQPEQCPHCGARTDFVELSRRRQLHTCLRASCRFVYEVGA